MSISHLQIIFPTLFHMSLSEAYERADDWRKVTPGIDPEHRYYRAFFTALDNGSTNTLVVVLSGNPGEDTVFSVVICPSCELTLWQLCSQGPSELWPHAHAESGIALQPAPQWLPGHTQGPRHYSSNICQSLKVHKGTRWGEGKITITFPWSVPSQQWSE